MNHEFQTTRWTQVRLASQPNESGRHALSQLCADSYEPVIAFLRCSGMSDESARDTAHDFFAKLIAHPNLNSADPAKGRFRTYLLGALKHFLAHQWERQHTLKRGGKITHLSLTSGTDTSPGIDAMDQQSLPPDQEFDRQWALHVIATAMKLLEADWQAAGRQDEYQLLRPFLTGGSKHGSLASAAHEHALDAATLRKNLSRLRQKLRQHIRNLIIPTLTAPADAEDEIKSLLTALARPQGNF